jgi:hypothetical protein
MRNPRSARTALRYAPLQGIASAPPSSLGVLLNPAPLGRNCEFDMEGVEK